MKISMLHSLKTKIAMGMTVLVLSTVIGIISFMEVKIEKNLLDSEYRAARTLLNTMLVSVENQYQSIRFHEESITSERKLQLKNVISASEIIIRKNYELALQGVISRELAQKRTIDALREIRYQDGVGYIWINDTTRSFPTMIMHPTHPELDGTVLDSPSFNCALGKNENLFRAFVDATADSGEGYVDYLWPKPLPDGLSAKKAKLSYVKRFEPWGWIFGTGLYIDDIEERVNNRTEAVKMELQESLKKITLDESGYGFIFNSKREVIVHPLYRDDELKGLKNPATGNEILVDLMYAADSGDGSLEYIWDKPEMKGQFRFRKSAYVVLYEPLEWYLATSFYIEELEKPIRKMRFAAFVFSMIFIILGLLFSISLAGSFTKPLRRIIAVSSMGSKGDYSSRLRINRRDEFGMLASNFDEFMDEIEFSHTKLSDSEKRFRTLFEKSIDARLIIENGVIIDCNNAAVLMIGSPDKSYLINKTFLEISPELQFNIQRSRISQEDIGKKLKHDSVVFYEWEYIKYDGSHFTAEVQLTDIGQSIDSTIVHARWRDITDEIIIREEKKRAEEQLIQMQKMETVGTLAGGFAHDFNNILNGIVGTLSLLRFTLKEKGKVSKQELEDELTIMEQASARAENMVGQLLTLSRKQTLHFEPVDFNKAVRNVVNLASGSIDKSVVISPYYVDENAVIQADSTQIEQIILNFCVNAAHAMTIMRKPGVEWGGELTLSVESVTATQEFCNIYAEAQMGEYWCLSITDTGVGMDKSTISKIFTPFFTTKAKGVGTGLGLSMVYNIIKQHSGFIYVSSEVGKGTSFDIYLPKLIQKDTVFDEAATQALQMGRGTILIIDDEPMMRKMARKMLEKCGYDTLHAANGVDGINIYEEKSSEIEMILLDMAMPGLSGKETFVALKRINENVKVLLTSGFREDERVQSVLSLGIHGFIQKPYDLVSLSVAVSEIINV